MIQLILNILIAFIQKIHKRSYDFSFLYSAKRVPLLQEFSVTESVDVDGPEKKDS